MVQPIFWVLLVILIFFVAKDLCTKEFFSPYIYSVTGDCSSARCSTSFPKFPGVPNLADLPKPPQFSTVQDEQVGEPTEEWREPVQWRSPDNTVIIDGYGGIGTIGGDNYEYTRGDSCSGGIKIEKLSGFDPY